MIDKETLLRLAQLLVDGGDVIQRLIFQFRVIERLGNGERLLIRRDGQFVLVERLINFAHTT